MSALGCAHRKIRYGMPAVRFGPVLTPTKPPTNAGFHNLENHPYVLHGQPSHPIPFFGKPPTIHVYGSYGLKDPCT